MEARDDRLFWLRRLRWRLRGAWLAPAFVVFTLIDAALLQLLPIAGDRGPGAVATAILAGFMNLLVVAVVGPLAALWLRRRHQGLPRFAARDRSGVIALAGLCALLLLGGLLHRPAVQDEQDDLRAQALAAQRYFLGQAPEPYRRNVRRMTTWKAGDGLYRTCIPGPDPVRQLCVYVTTAQSPPGVTRDPSQESNLALAGPDAVIARTR